MNDGGVGWLVGWLATALFLFLTKMDTTQLAESTTRIKNLHEVEKVLIARLILRDVGCSY